MEQDHTKHPVKPFPIRIQWQIVAGPEFDPIQNIQTYDMIYDETDLKLRKMELIDGEPKFIDQVKYIKGLKKPIAKYNFI